MIEFASDQLLVLAQNKQQSGHLKEALEIIQRAPESVDKLRLEHRIRYALGKKTSAEGDFHSSLEHFKACVGSTVDNELRNLAQDRCKLLNSIFSGAKKSVTTASGIHAGAKLKSTTQLSPDSLMPEIWFVGSAAAYRSGYDAQWYDNLSKLIRIIKHEADPKTLSRLGELLADFVFSYTPVLTRVDYIVPVPTSPDRWNERGYRIPNRLAQEISSRCAVPMITDVLETVGNLPELRNIPRWYREKAIKGAYGARKNEKIKGYSLLIVDDIITTGSTVTEIAKTLLNAGASEIAAISLAHTERST